jgi:hypothetical protein
MRMLGGFVGSMGLALGDAAMIYDEGEWLAYEVFEQ